VRFAALILTEKRTSDDQSAKSEIASVRSWQTRSLIPHTHEGYDPLDEGAMRTQRDDHTKVCDGKTSDGLM